MFALVIENDPSRLAPLATALADRGYRVVTAGRVEDAQILARGIAFDVIVQSETLGSRLTHAALLSAARRNPDLSAIVLTNRGREDADELFEMLPNLYGLLPGDAALELILTFVDAAQAIGPVRVGARPMPLVLTTPDRPESLETSLSTLEKLLQTSEPARNERFPDPVH